MTLQKWLPQSYNVYRGKKNLSAPSAQFVKSPVSGDASKHPEGRTSKEFLFDPASRIGN
jgi:hypothetical protein